MTLPLFAATVFCAINESNGSSVAIKAQRAESAKGSKLLENEFSVLQTIAGFDSIVLAHRSA